MITIWKYDLQVDLQVDDVIEVEMPENAMLLHADSQRPRQDPEIVSVWAMVDTEARRVTRRFRIAGTGQEFSPFDYANVRHVGTAIVANGTLVWHVFDLGVLDPVAVPRLAVHAAQTEDDQPAGKIPEGVGDDIHPDDLPGS